MRNETMPDFASPKPSRHESQFDVALHAVEIYAQRHPRPAHVTLTQAAQMLELSRPTVRKLLSAGKLKLNGCGLIPIEQVDRLLRADYA